MHTSSQSLLRLVLVSGLVVAGCTSGATTAPSSPTATAGGASSPAAPSAAPSVAPSGSAAGATGAGGSVTLGVGASATLGSFLTGASGMTLYIRTSDPANGSSCSGGCASAWPPLTAAAGAQPAAGSGVTGTIGTFTRSDGTLQVTYDGKALYYYAGDSKPGDTNGQGVGGVWFVAKVAGTGAGSTSAPAATPSPKSTGITY